MHVFTIRTQIDNRIADYLSWSMISSLAAAIGLKDGHAVRSQYFIGRDDSVLRRAPTESQRVRMLEQKQRIRLCARQNGRFGLLLQIECGGVFDAAQSFDFQSSVAHANVRATNFSWALLLPQDRGRGAVSIKAHIL